MSYMSHNVRLFHVSYVYVINFPIISAHVSRVSERVTSSAATSPPEPDERGSASGSLSSARDCAWSDLPPRYFATSLTESRGTSPRQTKTGGCAPCRAEPSGPPPPKPPRTAEASSLAETSRLDPGRSASPSSGTEPLKAGLMRPESPGNHWPFPATHVTTGSEPPRRTAPHTTQHRTGSSREPIAESRGPRTENQERKSREPIAESREPRTESREPGAESRDPGADIRGSRAEPFPWRPERLVKLPRSGQTTPSSRNRCNGAAPRVPDPEAEPEVEPETKLETD